MEITEPFSKLREDCIGDAGAADGAVKNWCRLLRVPNLFTVPGDPVLGHVIAEGAMGLFAALPAVVVSLCMYCFGLVGNDLNDIEEDKEERPERPLASGAISKRAARLLAGVFLVAGLTVAWHINTAVFILAVSLGMTIWMYNKFLKRNSFLGPLGVSTCRVLSLLCGYHAAGTGSEYLKNMLYFSCIVWLIYFFAVSLIAYHETRRKIRVEALLLLCTVPVAWAVSAPFVSMAFYPALLLKESNPSILLAVSASCIFTFIIAKNISALVFKSDVRGTISSSAGELIVNIILLQTAGCAFVGYPRQALAVMMLFIPAKILGKIFYSS
ncbi:MAG: UbiA family prenyltransferase [Victivallales bacterium]|nr:UbiA family prenyltransferase [Victivallales bacterium]